MLFEFFLVLVPIWYLSFFIEIKNIFHLRSQRSQKLNVVETQAAVHEFIRNKSWKWAKFELKSGTSWSKIKLNKTVSLTRKLVSVFCSQYFGHIRTAPKNVWKKTAPLKKWVEEREEGFFAGLLCWIAFASVSIASVSIFFFCSLGVK